MKRILEPEKLERLVDSTLRKDTPEDYDRLLAERRKVDPDAMDVHLVSEHLEHGSLRIRSVEDMDDGTSEVSFSCRIRLETEFGTRSYDCSGKLSLDAFRAIKSLRWEKFEEELLPEPGEEAWGREQRMIDPLTGENITAEALESARRQYEVGLEQVIEEAVDKIASGAPRTDVWAEAEGRIKALQWKLWDSHKGGWLQDWLELWAKEDRFTRDLKQARHRLGVDEPRP